MSADMFINNCKVGLVGMLEPGLAKPIGRWQPVRFGPW